MLERGGCTCLNLNSVQSSNSALDSQPPLLQHGLINDAKDLKITSKQCQVRQYIVSKAGQNNTISTATLPCIEILLIVIAAKILLTNI